MSKGNDIQFFIGGTRPDWHLPRPMDYQTGHYLAQCWAEEFETGDARFELITQREASKRLGISVQFLRTLDSCFPPRGSWGRGHEALYVWPSVAMWFLSLGVAKNRKATGDVWGWSLWLAEQEEIQEKLCREIGDWQSRQ